MTGVGAEEEPMFLIMEGSKLSPKILPRAKNVMVVNGFGDIGCCFNLVCLHMLKVAERCPTAVNTFNYSV